MSFKPENVTEMGMLQKLLMIVICCSILNNATAQGVGDVGTPSLLSTGALGASKMENTPVNLFTGIPSISIPIFQFSHHSGIETSVSISYYAGGIRVNETPGIAGLGWNLNAGGVIVRNLRGMPDDFPVYGFLNASSIPDDYNTLASQYYNDSIDAQQDVFQFNINGRSGKFLIGKNNQIVQIPETKLRISYRTSPSSYGFGRIIGFTLTAENGVKYLFNDYDTTKTWSDDISYRHKDSGFVNAWYLTDIVSPFGNDTIHFYYQKVNNEVRETLLNYQKLIGEFDTLEMPKVKIGQAAFQRKLSGIEFPDNRKLSFVYDPNRTTDGVNRVLNSIQISDSVFRYGYLFEWRPLSTAVLAGIRTYTSKGLNPGYHFDYYSPIFPIDSIYNKRDHWGFYNGAANDTSKHFPAVPYVFPNGANREPNDSAIAGTLKSITDPAGGVTYYDFECNDVYRPYELIPDYQVFNGMVHFSDTISLHHVYRNVDTFKLSYVSLRKLNNISPISVNAELICRITNFDSSVVFGTHTVNLYDLYQSGEQYLAFSNLPDGQVLFKASLSAGSAITARNMFMKLEWDKEIPNTVDRIKSNGIRIRQIRHYDPVTGITDTIKTFRYVMNNGRSSGFLGVKPVYTHPYQVNFDNGSIYMTNSYTALNREPVNHFDFSEGSQVSYGRVEVIRGSIYNNLGKEVHEFTTLADFQDYVKPVRFPYVPQFQRDWLLALPKKVSIYNKDGRLIQTTTNEFNYRTSSYDNQYFRSLKLGKLSSTYSGYEIIPANLLSESFEGRFYYPETGRADIKKTTEVFYYEDQSTRQNVQEIFYDDQFNVTRLLSDYDKSRNLKIEKRIYYPYNYTLVGPVGRLRDSLIFASISAEDWILGDGNPRLIGIQISEFQELPQGYIKPRSSYALRSNKPIPLSQIGEFNPAVLVRNSTLIKEASRNTIFDEKGNLVEVLNPQTGISNVVIMGYSGNLPVATVTQALKSDVAYSSFEASDHGGWELGSAVDFVYEGITGKRAYSLAEGEIVKSGLNSGKTYILTYWKHGSGTVSVSGSHSNEELDTQNGWTLVMHKMSQSSTVTISGNATIDELRLYPEESNMTTKTYEPMLGVTSECDANNSIVYQEYDSLLRIKIVRDKDKNILKKHEYPDVITPRNMQNPAKLNYGAFELNPTTGRYDWKCIAQWAYPDGTMSEAFLDPDQQVCPPKPNVTWLPVE